MTTIPIEDEKDFRLISEMEFANDTTPEEKAALRKWTKLAQELDGVQKEILRCEVEWKKLSESVTENEPLPAAASDLAQHIHEEKMRTIPLKAATDAAQMEWETLRDKNEPGRKEKAWQVRQLLMNHGLQTAQEIIDDGCTGLFHLDMAIEDVRFIRENMGGARVSLPCYVGPDRYCLIHQTIGGLQFGQKALFPEAVPAISRNLTPEEKGHATLVENVRRREGTMRDGKAILTGQKVPDDLGIETMSIQDAEFKRRLDAAGSPHPESIVGRGVKRETSHTEPQAAPSFTCPEHGAISWSCRYCLAQALVNGSLAPEIFLQKTIATIEGPGTAALEPVVATNVAAYLEGYDAAGAHEVKVYAKVATFKRKLAME